MNQEAEQTLCKNCQSALNGGLYCSQCGQKVVQERFSMRQLFHDTVALLTNVERGFWYTMKMLLLDPAKVVRDYLSGRTVCYYHPFRYLVILTTFSILVMLSLGLFDEQQNSLQQVLNPAGLSEETIQRQQAVNEQVKKYLNFISLLVVPFISLVSYRIFRKRGFNFAEHLIINTFLLAQATLINIAFSFPAKFFPHFLIWSVPLSILGSSLYYAYFLRGFFRLSTGRALFQGFLVHLFGYLAMFIALSIMVTIIMVVVLAAK